MRQIHVPFGDAHAPERGRSSLQFPAYAGAELLERTMSFRDRVRSSGGTIEDGALEGLYDPILRRVKEWGLLDDLVFFGAASAVENNSGSIPKLFDASGNENDATQTTTSDQPAVDTNGIGGQWTADFDGSDDNLDLFTQDFSQPYDVISVLVGTQTGKYESWLDTTDRSPIAARSLDSDRWNMYAGSQLTGSSTTGAAKLVTNRFDGGNSVIRLNGSQDVTGNAGTEGVSGDDLVIGQAPVNSDFHYSGRGAFLFIVDDLLGDVEKIESIINDYYSIY